MSNLLYQIHGQERDIGFPVRRLLPAAVARTVGPFVFFDHMGPARFAPSSTEGDVRPHPHIGLATVTYLYSGAFVHRDSLGNVQRIVPGDINWMAAGRGIVHSERVPDDVRAAGAAVQGLQMWVALPVSGELGEAGAPWFRHYASADLPVVDMPGSRMTVLIGSAFGATSPVLTASPTLYAAIDMDGGARMTLAADQPERGLYVVRGTVSLDAEAMPAGTLAVLRPGAAVELTTDAPASAMLLGGAPLDGPRFVWWNFVSSSKAAIETAKLAWAKRRLDIFPNVPGDEAECIPLPQR
jgi:redox-sensitive bicupin YhaK (pirin superfamily)